MLCLLLLNYKESVSKDPILLGINAGMFITNLLYLIYITNTTKETKNNLNIGNFEVRNFTNGIKFGTTIIYMCIIILKLTKCLSIIILQF